MAQGGRIRGGSASRPPRPRRGSPARCPSTARQARARWRARAAGGSTAASPPGRRRPAASSSGRGRRRTRREARSSSGGTPDFDSSPERFTSSSAGTVSRCAADAEASEWTSSQTPLTTLALFDWRWPMKCQRKASPWAACLRSRSWARFSPTTSTPAAARTPMSSSETYFVAATITRQVPPRPGSAPGSRGRRQATRAITPWTPRGFPVRRCEKNSPGCRTCRVGAEHVVDPGLVERALGGGPEVELPSRTTSAPNAPRRASRPRPRPGSSTARSPGRPRPRAARPTVSVPTPDDAGEQAAPAGVRTATAGWPSVRASAIGSSPPSSRGSAARPSVQRPSPGSPRAPGRPGARASSAPGG